MKVTRMLAWNSSAPSPASFTRSSLTQAPRTPRNVLLARAIPWRIASSNDSLDVQLSSVTLATDMADLLFKGGRPV
jgi:hypothetical protein